MSLRDYNSHLNLVYRCLKRLSVVPEVAVVIAVTEDVFVAMEEAVCCRSGVNKAVAVTVAEGHQLT